MNALFYYRSMLTCCTTLRAYDQWCFYSTLHSVSGGCTFGNNFDTLRFAAVLICLLVLSLLCHCYITAYVGDSGSYFILSYFKCRQQNEVTILYDTIRENLSRTQN